MKHVGYMWNDRSIEIVEIDGEMYALYGWNGEAYNHCWKVLDIKGLDKADEDIEYILTPVVQGVGDVDEDGNYDSYETINYDISIA